MGIVKNIILLAFDGTVRSKMVTENNRLGNMRPTTSLIASTNVMPNDQDMAFRQRFLHITWQPLRGEFDSEMQVTWNAVKDLVSCLLPDMAMITLSNGKLHTNALLDCAEYVNKCSSQVMSRPCNLWGIVLYFALMLEAMSNGDGDDVAEIIDYVCKQSVRQTFITTRFSTNIERFIVSFFQVKDHAAVNPIAGSGNDTIHWHNYRTDQRPEGWGSLTGTKWVAIRLEAICFVVKNILKITYNPDEIRQQASDIEGILFSRAYFYDLSSNDWPIAKTIRDDLTGLTCKIPLSEVELYETGTCKRFACMFIKQDKIESIQADMNRIDKDLVDYKAITVKSADKDYNDGLEYNFYNSVTGNVPSNEASWFGFEAVCNTPFAPYCGGTNWCNLDKFQTGIENLSIDEGYDPAAIFDPVFIARHFGTDLPPDREDLPVTLRINPFTFRNDGNDVQMPNDEYSNMYHTHIHDADGEALGEINSETGTPHKARMPVDLTFDDEDSRIDEDSRMGKPTEEEMAEADDIIHNFIDDGSDIENDENQAMFAAQEMGDETGAQWTWQEGMCCTRDCPNEAGSSQMCGQCSRRGSWQGMR